MLSFAPYASKTKVNTILQGIVNKNTPHSLTHLIMIFSFVVPNFTLHATSDEMHWMSFWNKKIPKYANTAKNWLLTCKNTPLYAWSYRKVQFHHQSKRNKGTTSQWMTHLEGLVKWWSNRLWTFKSQNFLKKTTLLLLNTIGQWIQ